MPSFSPVNAATSTSSPKDVYEHGKPPEQSVNHGKVNQDGIDALRIDADSHDPLRMPESGAKQDQPLPKLIDMDHMIESNPVDGLTMQKSTKVKPRGIFTASRRAEVSQIRKQGACMRCRMLKKPCSDGTPCTTCTNISTARLWKAECLRTRLAEEFTLWATGWFCDRALSEVASAVQGRNQRSLDGQIQVSFFPESNPFTMGAAVMLSSPVSSRDTEPCSKRRRIDMEEDIILCEGSDDISSIIQAYMDENNHFCIAAEPDHVLRKTLLAAQDIIKLNVVAETSKPVGAEAKRSSYTLQNQLLENVVELWVLTSILTLSDEVGISIRYAEHSVSATGSTKTQPNAKSMSPVSPRSTHLILAQLCSVIETRCSALNKTISSELERRILQRQQVCRFATFLASVIFLNCIERMTGFHRSVGTTKGTLNSHQNLWQQGPRFADILLSLLRMRALIPDVEVRESDGNLAMSSKKRKVETHDDQERLAREWIEELDVKGIDVRRWRDDPGEDEDGDEGARKWDLRFVSRALLPAGEEERRE